MSKTVHDACYQKTTMGNFNWLDAAELRTIVTKLKTATSSNAFLMHTGKNEAITANGFFSEHCQNSNCQTTTDET